MEVKIYKIKKHLKAGLVLPILLLYFVLPGTAQVAQQELGHNNLRARFYADGGLFWDGKNSYFEAPKGSGQHTISAAALWIGGLDAQRNIRVAAQTYRETGSDFWPGPLDSTGNTDAATSAAYNKVWKVTKLEIDSFLAGLSVPKSIIDWPGNGNSAKGYSAKLAPYVDVDNNGIYEPSKGDYPEIKGDAMLWWVFNDQLKPHTESGALPLGIEVQASAYTYNCADDPLLNNAVFVKYKIINRSKNIYDSVHAGLWADLDIGNNFDDYVGSMPALNSFFGYNADNNDNDTTVVTLQKDTLFYKGYDGNLPVQSITFLQGLKNISGASLPMSYFIYYNNEKSIKGNPSLPDHFYHYLNGHWMDGTPITVGGDGKGGTSVTPYAFPGDPADVNAWSEKSAGNQPNDRRGLGSFGPITLKPGDEQEIITAFTFHRSASGQTEKSLELMKKQVTELQQRYQKGAITPCTGISLCQNGEDCVWPGDANKDKKADIYDIFHIGYAFGETGPARSMASVNWDAQRAADWTNNFPNGANFKHADADGNGVIDSLDVLPILLNYSKTHNKTDGINTPNATDPVLAVDILEDSVNMGAPFTVRIKLGDGSVKPEDVYGIAFRLNYDNKVIDSNSADPQMLGGWLGDNQTEIIGIVKDDYQNGKTDAGVTRKNKVGLSDTGIIINFKYVISDNISGGFRPTTTMNLSDVVMVNSKLQQMPVTTQSDSIKIVKKETGIAEPYFISNNIKLYPNPAQSLLNIDLGRTKVQAIRIFSIHGKEIMSIAQPQTKIVNLDVNQLPAGIYLVQLQSAGGSVITKKFSKTSY